MGNGSCVVLQLDVAADDVFERLIDRYGQRYGFLLGNRYHEP